MRRKKKRETSPEKENKMKHLLLKMAIWTSLTAVVLLAAHYQRGYWAAGGEVFLPMLLAAWMIKMELRKEDERW